MDKGAISVQGPTSLINLVTFAPTSLQNPVYSMHKGPSGNQTHMTVSVVVLLFVMPKIHWGYAESMPAVQSPLPIFVNLNVFCLKTNADCPDNEYSVRLMKFPDRFVKW